MYFEEGTKLNYSDYITCFDTMEECEYMWNLNKYPLRYGKCDPADIRCMHYGVVDLISPFIAKQVVMSIIIENVLYYVDYDKLNSYMKAYNDNKLKDNYISSKLKVEAAPYFISESCLVRDCVDAFKSSCDKPYFLIYRHID